MKIEKNIVRNRMVSTEILVSVVVPFILFWGGALTPVFTDDFEIILLSFAPFYGYMLLNERKFNEKSVLLSRIVFLSSLFIGFVFSILGYNNIVAVFEKTGYIMLVNVIPSFIFMIYVVFCVESKDPSKWSSYTTMSN